jgi:ketosteroid isomerase-like protein
MKYISAILLLAIVSAFTFAQTKSNNIKREIQVTKKTDMRATQTKDTLELNQIQQRLIKAWVSKDRATINSILADDWVVTDPGGRVLTKAQVMVEFDSGERQLESGAIDEVKVRLFGDVAVVTGRTAATGSYQGNRVSVKMRFSDVFVKRNGRWYAVASQATLIAQ